MTKHRKAFLDGMTHAFNLVSEIMERQIGYNPKFYSFAKFDPDYVAGDDETEGGEDGPDDDVRPADFPRPRPEDCKSIEPGDGATGAP